MRESEFAIRQLIIQRDEAEREKWTILRHARDEAQRSLSLTTQLAARDAKIHQLQEELSQVLFQSFANGRGHFFIFLTMLQVPCKSHFCNFFMAQS